ncbi:ATP-binding cassette domain-containing protein [Apibacter raozihei]|uniref:ATP-binding cassette domain-containing protein n=1 Tax=Apibacter raozihei TaxID=2500547 RepID=UPI000FE4071C|nr:ATP-binding cassette domain-containing protein [Apibacter raozihei]
MNPVLELKNIVPLQKFAIFSNPINWKIKPNEHWAIIGSNGSGKNLLIDILLSKYGLKTGEIYCKDEYGNNIHIRKCIKFVAFHDIYSLADLKNSYYQQRWNTGLEEDIPTVKNILSKEPDQSWIQHLVTAFKIEDLNVKKINLLSSGELRKFLIVKSLSSKPKFLIMDNPFIGLDSYSRKVLRNVLENLTTIGNLQIILLVSDINDIPEVITHILPVKNKTILPEMSYSEFTNDQSFQMNLFKSNIFQNKEQITINNNKNDEYTNAIIFKNVTVKYGSRTILKNLNWIVKKGEKWALLGPNGSGKSTLLSLVAGDNPQAYANDITLFDKKRGTGESIWDIKKHIGYVSPEMHLYYQKNVSCKEIIGSGFFDTIGLYKKCNEKQNESILEWMKIFGISHLKNISFLNVSTGEQRLILLARVFIKNPSLIILDEPLHGLDMENKKQIKKLIEAYCDKNKALIYVTHYKYELPNVVNNKLELG